MIKTFIEISDDLPLIIDERMQNEGKMITKVYCYECVKKITAKDYLYILIVEYINGGMDKNT